MLILEIQQKTVDDYWHDICNIKYERR